MESRLSAYRLSMPQFAALSLLALTSSATAADVARQLMLSPQAGHTLVTRLHAAGHVQPVAGANDGGRAIPMQITEQGRTVLRRAAVDVDDVQETFLGALSFTERTRLLNSLKKCLPAHRTGPPPRTATEHDGP